MLGYDATEFNVNSHCNITYCTFFVFSCKFQFLIFFVVIDSMHNAFDDGNWALVPEKSAREHILSTLQQAKVQGRHDLCIKDCISKQELMAPF
jgi:hypothetical protein